MSNENEENDSESLEELAKQKLKKDLGKNENQEDVKLERDELKERLSIIALKDFEQTAKSTAEKLAPNDKTKQKEIIDKIGENPDVLLAYQAKLTVDEPEDDGTEKVPPSGAKIPPYKPAQKGKVTVENLYEILSSNTSTVEEKREANKKLDSLWKKSLENKKVAHKAIREIQEGE